MRTTIKALPTVLRGGVTYLIRDEFTDTRAAGAVDGTAATPGPGVRNGADPDNKLSVSDGALSWLKHTSAHANNSFLRFGVVERAAGVAIRWRARYVEIGRAHV